MKHLLIDVGSTIIKVFEVDDSLRSARKRFVERSRERGVHAQVLDILGSKDPDTEVRICSSANGGIKVGILCATTRYSGAAAKSLVLLAGGNPVFVKTFAEFVDSDVGAAVDALVIVGGIDNSDAPLLAAALRGQIARMTQHPVVIYAGNRHLQKEVRDAVPAAIVVDNLLSNNLKVKDRQLLHVVRNLYLNDLIDRKEISALLPYSRIPILPTPAIVAQAAERLFRNDLDFACPSPAIVIDIGGATTDLYFGKELLLPGQKERISSFGAQNRYVFTELGVVASRESTALQLAKSTLLFDFFTALDPERGGRRYLDFREGVFEEEVLFYACYFLVMQEVFVSPGADVPGLDKKRVRSIVMTGGASQKLDTQIAKRLMGVIMGPNSAEVFFTVDRDYTLWAHGLLAFGEDSGTTDIPEGRADGMAKQWRGSPA